MVAYPGFYGEGFFALGCLLLAVAAVGFLLGVVSKAID